MITRGGRYCVFNYGSYSSGLYFLSRCSNMYNNKYVFRRNYMLQSLTVNTACHNCNETNAHYFKIKGKDCLLFFCYLVLFESQRCCLGFRLDTQLISILIYTLKSYFFLGLGSNTEPLGRFGGYYCSITLQKYLCF